MTNLNLGLVWRLKIAAKRIALVSRQGVKMVGLSEQGVKF